MRRIPRSVGVSAWAYLRIRVDGETGVDSTPSPEFNLSPLKALRSLEVGNLMPARHAIVMEVFSAITSPVFSELVIVDPVAHLQTQVKLFETLRTMSQVRPLQISVFARGPGWVSGGVTTGVGERFRLGGCEGSSRFSGLSAHRP
jgi:hypothetical protein